MNACTFSQPLIASDNVHSGIYFGAGVGIMFPTGNLIAIGNSNNLSIEFGIYDEQMQLGIAFDIFTNSLMRHRNTYHIWYNDSLFAENNYGGANIALTYGYKLFQINKLQLYTTAAIGYTSITYKSIEPLKDISKGSLLFSPGIHLQYPLSANANMRLRLEYQIAKRKLKESFSTDFSGNMINLSVMYMGFIF